jgi:carboxyl-terminal processing protease
LDAHSSFMPPRMFQEMQVETQGEFGGIGIEITVREEWLTIVSPIEDTPASREGLQPGDRIVAIEGKSTRGISLMDAVDKLRGEVGTEVEITVMRPETEDNESFGEPFDVTLVRDKIQVRSVNHELKDDGRVVYIRLTQFQSRTGSDLRKALAEYELDDKLGIVLDLRSNPGGLLDQAIEVTGFNRSNHTHGFTGPLRKMFPRVLGIPSTRERVTYCCGCPAVFLQRYQRPRLFAPGLWIRSVTGTVHGWDSFRQGNQ